jgi:hypothetical protein
VGLRKRGREPESQNGREGLGGRGKGKPGEGARERVREKAREKTRERRSEGAREGECLVHLAGAFALPRVEDGVYRLAELRQGVRRKLLAHLAVHLLHTLALVKSQ